MGGCERQIDKDKFPIHIHTFPACISAISLINSVLLYFLPCYISFTTLIHIPPPPLNTFAILNPSTIFITISWHCPFALQIIIIIVLTAEQHNNNNNEILPKNIKERSSNFQACEPEKMRHLRDLYIYFIIPQFSTYLPTSIPVP